jgi:hypothetical protein
MTEALAALTKLVKVVMSYRPDRKAPTKPVKNQPKATPKRVAKSRSRG